LGIDPSEIIGKSNRDIFQAGLAEKITANDRRVLNSDLSEEHVEYEEVFEEHTWLTRKFAIPMIDNEPMMGGIAIDITERKLLEEELHRLSIVDELTGLYNRRGFLALSEQQLKFAERKTKNIILHFIDLDYMKWINDTLGHQEGDTALVEIAAILRQTFRKSDIIGRMGGDEFAVLAIDTAHEERKTLARLRQALDSYNRSETRRYKLSLSVGTAHFDPENPISLDELIARADNLMYEEKRTKRHKEVR
jgi:diguanylate cyclase (GGDEF)-like protein